MDEEYFIILGYITLMCNVDDNLLMCFMDMYISYLLPIFINFNFLI